MTDSMGSVGWRVWRSVRRRVVQCVRDRVWERDFSAMMRRAGERVLESLDE